MVETGAEQPVQTLAERIKQVRRMAVRLNRLNRRVRRASSRAHELEEREAQLWGQQFGFRHAQDSLLGFMEERDIPVMWVDNAIVVHPALIDDWFEGKPFLPIEKIPGAPGGPPLPDMSEPSPWSEWEGHD